MIGYIEGTLMSHRGSTLVVQTSGGVGYTVHTTEDTAAGYVITPQNKQPLVALWMHTAVRDNDIDLYGFPTEAELALFELLITLSGIGPKTALNIMNAAPAATLRQGIASGDPDYLAKIPGIGKKNAEKMVRELSEKVAALASEAGDDHESMAHASKAAREESDALEALRGLGWSDKEVRAALAEVAKQHRAEKDSAKIQKKGSAGASVGAHANTESKPMSASERVREALKLLGRS